MEAQKKEEKLTASQGSSFEESEESSSSDNDMATASQFGSNKSSTSEVTDIEELAPQDTQGPAANKVDCQVTWGPAASDGHRQVAQGLREVEEESTRSKDEDGGTACENVQDVARKNGMHWGHTV